MVITVIKVLAVGFCIVHFVLVLFPVINQSEAGISVHPMWIFFLVLPWLNILGLSGILKGILGCVLIGAALICNILGLCIWTFLALWPMGHIGAWGWILGGAIAFTEVALLMRVFEMAKRRFASKV